jgi:MFS transporter, PPP family, 3-phenylpropionic acid transporter
MVLARLSATFTAPIPRRTDWILKGLHFTVWAAIGCYWPFANLYFRSVGLTGIQIGWVAAASALVGAVSATLWSLINDRIGKTRLIFAITCAGTILSMGLMSQAGSFFPLLLAVAFFAFMATPILPLIDTVTLQLLGPNHDYYGAYRMWGTLGFICVSAFSGFILERLGLRVIFAGYSLGLVAFWLVTLFLPNVRAATGGFSFAGFQKLVRSRAWIIFAIAVLLLWGSWMGSVNFLGVAVNEMGGGESAVGLASTISALSEAPMMLAGAWLLRRLGPRRMIAVAFIIFTVRLVLYSLMPDYHWVYFINILHGISYVPYLIGSVAYASRLAPEGLQTTSQGLLVTVASLSNILGGIGAGYLFDASGPAAMFLILAGVCLSGWLVFTVGTYGKGSTFSK